MAPLTATELAERLAALADRVLDAPRHRHAHIDVLIGRLARRSTIEAGGDGTTVRMCWPAAASDS